MSRTADQGRVETGRPGRRQPWPLGEVEQPWLFHAPSGGGGQLGPGSRTPAEQGALLSPCPHLQLEALSAAESSGAVYTFLLGRWGGVRWSWDGAPKPTFLPLLPCPSAPPCQPGEPAPPSSEPPQLFSPHPPHTPGPQALTRRDSAWLCRQRLEPTVRTPDRPNSERPGASSTGPSSSTWFTSG